MPERIMNVDVGGAHMIVPIDDWPWQLRYCRKEPDRGTKCDDRMLAAAICDSYLYLIEECTKEEAWRRIKLMRAAIRNRRQEMADK